MSAAPGENTTDKNVAVRVDMHSGAVPILHIRGELGEDNTALIKSTVDSLRLAGHRRISFDLGQVAFLDSGGVRILVRIFEEQRARRGQICIVSASHAVHRVFGALRLTHMLAVLATSPT